MVADIPGFLGVQYYNAAATAYTLVQAYQTLSANFTLTLPQNAGTLGQALITDGTGNLSWASLALASYGTPVSVGTANAQGIAASFSRSDHVHAHGNQPGGATGSSMHTPITSGDATTTAGFINRSDWLNFNSAYNLTNAATNLSTPSTLALRYTDGSTHFTGVYFDYTGLINVQMIPSTSTPLSYTLTLPINAGLSSQVLSTDGTGVLSWVDILTPTFAVPVTIGTANAAGSAATYVRSDHVHAHGNQAGGATGSSMHTAVTSGDATTTAGFINRSDWLNFNSAYNLTNAATNLSTPSTLALRYTDGSTHFTGVYFDYTGLINVQMIPSALTPSSYSLTLPTTAGTNYYVLTTDGSGVLSWTFPEAGTAPSGFGYMSTADYNTLHAATNLSTASTLMERDSLGATHLKTLQLDGTTSGTLSITVPSTVTSYSVTLPAAVGTNGQYLTTDASGILSWYTIPNANSVTTGLLLNTDWINFESAYTAVNGYGNATNISTGSTLMARDASSYTHLKGLQLDGISSGTILFTAPSSFAGYSMTWPATTGTAGQYLTTDGSSNFVWYTIPNANLVTTGLLLNTDWANFNSAYTAINGYGPATNLSTISTLVARDSSGYTHLKSLQLDSPSTSYNIQLSAPASILSSFIFNLPPTIGTSNYILTTDGSGNSSWAYPLASASTTGFMTMTAYNFLYGATNAAVPSTLVLRDGGGYTNLSGLILDRMTYNVTFIPSSSQSINYQLTLPTTAGTSGYVLSTDGSGVLSWVSNGGAFGVSVPQPVSGTVGSTGSAATFSRSDHVHFHGNLAGGLLHATGNGSTAGFIAPSDWTNFNSAYLAINGYNPATNLSTGSTLMARDSSGYTHLKSLQLDAFTSGAITLTLPATVSNYSFSLPPNPGTSGYFLTTDGTGVTSWIASGSVTSVGLSAPASILSVSNSPVTGSGTLALNLVSQIANTFWAAPNGVSGNPSFRALVGADLPSINLASGVTGILAAVNGGTGINNSTNTLTFTGTGTLILGSNTLTVGGTSSINQALLTTSTPTFTGLNLTSGGFTTTILNGATTSWDLTLPINAGSSGQVLTTNGSGVTSWAAGGTVTSVGLSLPPIFNVTVSPITNSGSLTATLANQTTNPVFASPNGLTGTPTFRSLVNADLPIVSVAKGGTGLSTTTNGQLLIGNGANFTLSALTGTLNQVIVTNGAGSITLSPPQSIGTSSSPTFASLNLTAGLMQHQVSNQVVLGAGQTITINAPTPVASVIYTVPDAGTDDTFVLVNATQTLTGKTWHGNNIEVGYGGTGISSIPSNGQVLIGNGSGYVLSTLTAGTGISITNGLGSITINSTVPGGTVTSVGLSAPAELPFLDLRLQH